MTIKRICFIAEGYPTAEEPIFTFVRQLVCSLADMGIQCSVIAPQSISKNIIRKRKNRPLHWVDITKNNSSIDIYQPKYISVSNKCKLTATLTNVFKKRSIVNVFSKIKKKPDVLYGHFWTNGLVAANLGKKHKLPVFVATGESVIPISNISRNSKTKSYLNVVNGVICVSQKNKNESLEKNLSTENKMTVIPNAIDSDTFYVKNKLKMRGKLGYNRKDFIVAFTGSFNNRKGVLRLSKAVNKLKDVKVIFIGSGEQKPAGENILFCGKLPHKQIVNYLNAADVFVLPTLAEGCSNAVIEAMACGLPIISSNLSFNDDILDEKNSIRIDPNNIEQIADAINYLKNNPQIKKEMSANSLIKAKKLDIDNRARRIMKFMEKNTNNIS